MRFLVRLSLRSGNCPVELANSRGPEVHPPPPTFCFGITMVAMMILFVMSIVLGVIIEVTHLSLENERFWVVAAIFSIVAYSSTSTP